MNTKSKAGSLFAIEIFGISLPLYLGIFALVLIAMRLEWLPDGMLGAFLVMMVFGGLFNTIGNHLPIVKPTLAEARSSVSLHLPPSFTSKPYLNLL
jgi:Na+/citrate or Na+/malate symporter